MGKKKANAEDVIKAYVECLELGKERGLTGYDLMAYIGRCVLERAETAKKLEEAVEKVESGEGEQ